MPNITKLLERTKKRLDLTEFFGEEAWITIKKLNKKTLTRISFSSIDTFSSKMGTELIKQLKEGKKYNKITPEMGDEEAIELLKEMNLTEEKSELMQKAANNIEQIALEMGVDPLEHNFVDENGKTFEWTYEVWMKIGTQALLKYVVDEIKSFSQGFSLGESKSKELSTP
jgi:hypothetical protein